VAVTRQVVREVVKIGVSLCHFPWGGSTKDYKSRHIYDGGDNLSFISFSLHVHGAM